MGYWKEDKFSHCWCWPSFCLLLLLVGFPVSGPAEDPLHDCASDRGPFGQCKHAGAKPQGDGLSKVSHGRRRLQERTHTHSHSLMHTHAHTHTPCHEIMLNSSFVCALTPVELVEYLDG